MRPRAELAIGFGIFAVVAIVAAAIGRSGKTPASIDFRTSTYLAGPNGARGFADALERLGVPVQRMRERPFGVRILRGASREAVVVLEPTLAFTAYDAATFSLYASSPRGGDLVAVGRAVAPLMRCFGFEPRSRFLDSVVAYVPGNPRPRRPAYTRAVLRPVHDSARRPALEEEGTTCATYAASTADTLLATERGEPVVLRLSGDSSGHDVVLAADAGLFRNRTMRDTDAGPFVLALFAGRYDRVVVDEYHHGFGPSGSLLGATIDWSLRSPYGWLVWQVAAVGVLALLAGGVRFGPIRSGIERRRRSPIEHVRALSTALAAARGHDVAIATLVQGLRRRLSPGAPPPREGWRRWLARLDDRSARPETRDAVRRLRRLTPEGASAERVMEVANAVEDVWKTLRR